MGGRRVSRSVFGRSVIAIEVVGFGVLIAMSWIEELLDLPHALLGAPATPVNTAECLMETVVTAAVGAVCVAATYRLLRRFRALEGLLPICAWCGKVRSGESWMRIEAYLPEHTAATVTHGLCPECARRVETEMANEP